VHEAVLSGQLKIINLIAKTCIHVLEQKDGFGIPPWRLALRNKHKDPHKKALQKDVARFLLAKQFGGKVRILQTQLSIHLYSRIIRWCENAKERVIAVHGFSKSSIRRKTFPLQEGLTGNKVLVDGFNNDLRDYPNSYDRLRTQYKFYYFINQDEKDKNGYPDLYFKTVGLIKTTVSSNQTLNNSKKPLQRLKYPSDRASPQTLPIWKKAVNAIIHRKTVLKYQDILVELGVEVDDEELELVRDKTEKIVEDKNAKKLKNKANKFDRFKLPNISNNKKVNSNETQKIDYQIAKQKNKAFKKSLAYFEEQYLLMRKNNRRRRIVFTNEDDLRYETLNMLKKYRSSSNSNSHNYSSYQNSVRIMDEVKNFKSKSWIQQIYIGSRIAQENAKRSIKKYSMENIV
jgi:hypothetical protein